MQSAVAFFMESHLTGDKGRKATSPKHLRVGVNSAMMECSAVSRLLMAKGVITEEEYFTALAEGMEAEVSGYEEQLPPELKGKVTFG